MLFDMIEEWKTVEDFPAYEISNQGRLRRVKAGHGATVEKILKQRLNTDGRVQYRLQQDGRDTYRQAHRMVLEAFVGPCPDTYECRHMDGNPLNNSVDNLQWGTRSENMLDKHRHGTMPLSGPPRKLTPDQIAEIRSLREEGMSLPQLGKKYGVAHRTIEMIVKRLTYRDLP